MSRQHTHPLSVHAHSAVHGLAPEAKVAATLAFVVAVVATPREEIWAFAVHAFLLLAVVVYAELPYGFVLRRVGLETPFVLFALFLPFVAGGREVEVAGVMLSVEGLWGAWNVLAKATLGVTASVVLVATTEVPEILRGLDRLRVPRLLTSIAGFMIRYLELLLAELQRMRVAMASRGHRATWLGQAGPLAQSAGALFVRSYERGERVYDAMLARGYEGSMPALGERRATGGEWAAALALPLTACAVALLGTIA